MSGYELEETTDATPEATPEKDLTGAPETLEGQELGTEKPVQAEGAEQTEQTEKTAEQVQEDANKPNFNPDEEVEIELGGKKFLMKQGEVISLLEKNQGLTEKEQKLSQLEKNLNRDYTQKTQEIAGLKKSFQTSFGTIPDADEIKALGKVYRAYQTNPSAKAAIDQILGGGAPAAQGAELNPVVGSLQQEIAELKARLEGFTSSIEEKESQKAQEYAQAEWGKWEAAQAKSGIKITAELDAEMSTYVPALLQKHPDWDSSRIFDKAYAIATMGQVQQQAVKKVLISVDEAKKRGSVKITPKAPAKSVSDQSYAELVS